MEDVAGLLELVAQVTGLPLHAAERESEQFRTRAREKVVDWLPDPESAEPNWEPPVERGSLFPADLLVPGTRRPVAAFFAGSRQKADSSMASAGQYLRWGLDVKPLLAHNGSLNSETIYRAQVMLEDHTAVVQVNEAAAETGYMPLRRTLADAGVPLV